MDNQIAIQYREILERFNKIIWTHKIHLCQADIYLAKRKKQNLLFLPGLLEYGHFGKKNRIFPRMLSHIEGG